MVFLFIVQAVTLAGQKMTDVCLSEDNVSEIIRLFIKIRLGHDNEVNGVQLNR